MHRSCACPADMPDILKWGLTLYLAFVLFLDLIRASFLFYVEALPSAEMTTQKEDTMARQSRKQTVSSVIKNKKDSK